MEPDELYLLENGPDQFKLTLSGSELQEQSLCFQKSRTTYRMAYLAEGVWADHKELLMSSELRLQQLGEKRIQDVNPSDIKFFSVLQKDSVSGLWVMWSAISLDTDRALGRIFKLVPISKTSQSFWSPGHHPFIECKWDSETLSALPSFQDWPEDWITPGIFFQWSTCRIWETSIQHIDWKRQAHAVVITSVLLMSVTEWLRETWVLNFAVSLLRCALKPKFHYYYQFIIYYYDIDFSISESWNFWSFHHVSSLSWLVVTII